MADDVPVTERRRVVIEYEIAIPSTAVIPQQRAPVPDLEQAVLQVLSKLDLSRMPL